MQDERSSGDCPACGPPEESGKEVASRETIAAGGCCTPPNHRSWINTLVSVAIIAAAIGVGVYSLWSHAGRTGGSATQSAVIPAAATVNTVNAPASSAPSTERPCGCGAAAPPEAVSSGGPIPGVPQTKCGGEQKPSCCGH